MFHRSKYFFWEGDKTAKISVVRLGDCSQHVDVEYETVAGNGAEEQFKAVKGVLSFPPGDFFESFEVSLVDDDKWELMSYFDVQLTVVRQPQYAVLGGVPKAMVYIVDDDDFPANFSTHPGPWQLIYAFCRLRWKRHYRRLQRGLVFLCYPKIHVAFNNLLPFLIVDTVLDNNLQNISLSWYPAAIISGAYALSTLLVWACEYASYDAMMIASSLRDLRVWLAQKYVWFSESTHSRIDDERPFLHAIISRSHEVIMYSWAQHFHFFCTVFDLLIQLSIAAFLEPYALLPIAVMLPITAVVVYVRQNKFLQLHYLKRCEEDRWVADINDMMNTWKLLNSYHYRDERAQAFAAGYTRFSILNRAVSLYEINTIQMVKTPVEFMLTGLLSFGVFAITKGWLKAGALLTLLQIYRRLGEDMKEIVCELVRFQRGMGALELVCEMLNQPLDVGEEMKVQQDQAAIAERLEQQAIEARMKNNTSLWSKLRNQVTVRFQTEHIVLRDVSYTYDPSLKLGNESSVKVAAATSLTCELPLGEMSCLKSELAGMGILTLMKLITGQLYPSKGAVNVPAHVRTLLCHSEPIIVDGTVYENLTFGTFGLLHKVHADAHVWAVAESLGLSHHLLWQPHVYCGAGGCNLRMVDRQVICIARAVLSDASALFFYKPCSNFTLEQKTCVYNTLNAWVRRAGIFSFDKAKDSAVPHYTVGKGLALSARTCYVSLDASEEVPPQITVVVALSASEGGRTRILMNRRKARGEWSAVDLARISTTVLSSMNKLNRLHGLLDDESENQVDDVLTSLRSSPSKSKRGNTFGSTLLHTPPPKGSITRVKKGHAAHQGSDAAGTPLGSHGAAGGAAADMTSAASSSSNSGRADECADNRADEREEARSSLVPMSRPEPKRRTLDPERRADSETKPTPSPERRGAQLRGTPPSNLYVNRVNSSSSLLGNGRPARPNESPFGDPDDSLRA